MTWKPPTMRVVVPDELDLCSADELLTAVADAGRRKPSRIELDCSSTRFCDVVGASTLELGGSSSGAVRKSRSRAAPAVVTRVLRLLESTADVMPAERAVTSGVHRSDSSRPPPAGRTVEDVVIARPARAPSSACRLVPVGPGGGTDAEQEGRG